jgi:hypothetical protein
MEAQPGQAAKVTLLLHPPRRTDATIVRSSRAQIVIETEADLGLYLPLKLEWDKYVVLGEVVERRELNGVRQATIQLAHLLDLDRVADHTKFWS